MLGRNRSKPQATLVSQESSAGPKSKGGFLNGNVVKSKGDDAAMGPRPVHLVDGARAFTTQR
jgi:hypothetical protein